MISENYSTINAPVQGQYKEKGSRFVAVAYPVSDPEQIKSILEKTRKEHHEAKHHCYAYMLGPERINWRVNDDGEPSGTGGRPILGQINSLGLTNILIVVSRYFGGTLLGVSGLINAYRSAAASALQNSEIINCTLQEYYKISFPYSSMNDVMKIVKEESIVQADQRFDLECSVLVNFSISASEKILERFSRIDGLKYEYVVTR